MGENNEAHCDLSGSELPCTVAQAVHCPALGFQDAISVITVWDTFSAEGSEKYSGTDNHLNSQSFSRRAGQELNLILTPQ